MIGLIIVQTRCEQPHEGREQVAVISQSQACQLAGHLMEMRRVRRPEWGMSQGKGKSDYRPQEGHMKGLKPLGSRDLISRATDEGALARDCTCPWRLGQAPGPGRCGLQVGLMSNERT